MAGLYCVSSGRPLGPAVSSARPLGPAVSSARPLGPAVSSARPLGPAVSSARPPGPAVSSARPPRPAHLIWPSSKLPPFALINLDLGIETCFFNGLNAFTKTWLHLVFPLYVWAIAGLIIFSARHSSKIARVFGNNSVPVLATLFLVSYAKLLRMIVTALSFTTVKYPYGERAVWSADGNIEYVQHPHTWLLLKTSLLVWGSASDSSGYSSDINPIFESELWLSHLFNSHS